MCGSQIFKSQNYLSIPLISRLLCLLLAITLMSQKNSQAQNVLSENSLNNLSFNLLGDASIGSIQYERFFPLSSNLFLSAKLGVGLNKEFCLLSCSDQKEYTTIPHHLTSNLGQDRSFVEIGLGGTTLLGDHSNVYLAYPVVGFRRIAGAKRKVQIRFYAYFPFTGLDNEDFITVPVGFSVGAKL